MTTTRHPGGQRTRHGFPTLHLLIRCYLGLAVLVLAATALLRDRPDLVTDAVWGRAVAAVSSALLMTRFARRAEAGRARSLLRLRISSALVLVAVVVILVLPGAFPLWMRVAQGVLGVVLLCIVLLVNGAEVRSSGRKA